MKRVFDLIAATLLLILCAPFIAFMAAAIVLETRQNPFLAQLRVGRDGKTFTLYKLCTFRRGAHGYFGSQEIRFGDARVSRVGQYLRRTKLDELPQLVNVLRGDMSVVGPRPDLPVQAQHYNERDNLRLRVRPGITGLAQVSGNTWLGWPDRIAIDLYYIRNRSARMDLAILRSTMLVILRGERPGDDPLALQTQGIRPGLPLLRQ